jgi:hypothetical protein
MDGKRFRPACRMAAAAALLLLVLAPGARAAGSDSFAGARFLHFGKADETDLTGYGTETGEMLTSDGQGACDEIGQRKLANTAWYYVIGNGRALSVGASGPVQMVVSVYRGSPFGSDVLGRVVDCRYAPNTSAVAWNSVDGQPYWIQVGLCWYVSSGSPVWCSWPDGAVPTALVVAISDPPAYDTRANAVELKPGVTYDNHGANEEAEVNSCNGTPYGNTVWLKWSAPTWGTAVFNLSGMPGVISIRRAGTDAVTHCGFGAAQARVVKGETLFLQVGGGSLGALGFDEGHFSIGVSIPDPDDDNDGFPNASDCRPADPAFNPGVPEIKDDGVDQNCNPGDDKARKPPTSGAFTVSGGRLRKFALNDVVKGSRVVVTCRSPSCRKRKLVVSKRLKRNIKRLNLPRGIVGPLRAGTLIRVQVLNRPNWIGRRFQWRMTSASTWEFAGFCQKTKKWRRC